MLSVIIILLFVNCFVAASEDKWVEIGTSDYILPLKGRNKTFEDATNYCKVKKARLPTFHSYSDYKTYRDTINAWGDVWLGYLYDHNRKLMTFTGFPSGFICNVGHINSYDYSQNSLDTQLGNCIVRLHTKGKNPAQLIYVHSNCNAHYHFACQKPKNPDDCEKNVATTTTKPETQTSPTPNATTEIKISTTPNATTEIETSTMSTFKTEIHTSAISNVNTQNETSTSSKKMFKIPDEIKPTTKSHQKVLVKPKDSLSKGKRTMIYISVTISVIGILVVIIVAVVLVRRRARKKAADGAISSKLSKKPYPIFTFSSVSEATKVKSQQKTHQRSLIGSLQKTLEKSRRRSKVNSLQKTQQKTQKKTQQKTQPTLMDDKLVETKKMSMPYHDFTPSKPTKSQNKGVKSTSKSRSQEVGEDSDYETVKP